MKFCYTKPKTLDEAVSCLQDTSKDFYVAGGTDLMVKIRSGLLNPKQIIEIGHLKELAGIEDKGATLRIGALSSHTELATSSLILEKAFVLAEAARTVGAPQIRNAATVGGNVCNASPAGDTLPALLVLNAQVELFSKAGAESMPLENFLFMPSRTQIKPGQIVCGFLTDTVKANEGAAFVKIGKRQALAISVVNGAALLRITNNTIEEARVAIGSVAVKTLRLPDVEAFLTGKEPSDALFAEAGNLAAELVKPIDDIRSTAEYRKDVAATVIKRAVKKAFERVGKGA